MKKSRDLDFLYELGTLRHMQRGWGQFGLPNVASDIEHTFRVIFLALLIARREGVKNEEKIMKMALIHDIPEARTGDQNWLNQVYVMADEDQATLDMLAGTKFTDFGELFSEYKGRESIEAKIVKDADNLDIDLELKEFEESGSAIPKKWAGSRRGVRDQRLFTKSAKKIWDEIQSSDPAFWHSFTGDFSKGPRKALKKKKE